MLPFDASQQRVLRLDPNLNARVLGAPGSGKTAVLVACFAEFLHRPGWQEHDVQVWGSSRSVTSSLRSAIERTTQRALGGTPVRTPASFAFSVVQRHANLAAEPLPRLLTGTAEDVLFTETLATMVDAAEFRGVLSSFSPQVFQSVAFRTELREFARVLNDYGIAAEDFERVVTTQPGLGSASVSHPVDAEQRELWLFAARVVAAVERRQERTRAHQYTSSQMLSRAARVVRSDERIPIPKLILVDDAQELGEGQLALMSALHERGTRFWVFGDPDIATSAFHGEHTAVLSRLDAELRRTGAISSTPEQFVELDTVYRHATEVRTLIHNLVRRVGTAGLGQQRAAVSATGLTSSAPNPVEFATVSSVTEQLGAVAHRLRRRALGLDGGAPVAWKDMVIICRSRSEVRRAARALAAHQVPTNESSAGVVLREHALVRDLVSLLQHVRGESALIPAALWGILAGEIGGVDPIAFRRLRAEVRIHEQRNARAQDRESLTVDEVMWNAFVTPGTAPLIDARSGRALRKLSLLVHSAARVHENGGTPREVLWEIWDATGLAGSLQEKALTQRGAASEQAHRTLDAVMGLFFALQRHEEQNSEQPVSELLAELLSSSVAEDTLAARSEEDYVMISTPQGVIGKQFSVVCVLGPQDGSWPNLKARGSFLGVTALERWLRAGPATSPSRKDTLHDELRLFVHSCARTTDELLVVAVADEDHHPSPFFGFGRDFTRHDPLPNRRLTVRGATAEMRRRLSQNPTDREALDTLVQLAEHGIPGAHPSQWYGIPPLSTDVPLVDLAGDPDSTVSVSPSRMEAVERCPLDWVIAQLGGSPSGAAQQLGTLLHHAFELGCEALTAEQIFAALESQWHQLKFDAAWQSEHARELAREMAVGLADYLADFRQSERALLGSEVPLRLEIGRAVVNGVADRLEALSRADGSVEVSVVDLKTGKSMPTATELTSHAQLQAYQLGVLEQGYDLGTPDPGGEPEQAGEHTQGGARVLNGGARLLYVDPRLRTTRGSDAGSSYRIAAQPQLTPEAQAEFITRVTEAAAVMAAGSFTARVEHHCSDPHAPGKNCSLHIIPSVSHA